MSQAPQALAPNTAVMQKCRYCKRPKHRNGLWRHEHHCEKNPNQAAEVTTATVTVLRRLADAGGVIDARQLQIKPNNKGKGGQAYQFPANYFGVNQSTLVRMERLGWLTREIDGKRMLALAITDAGRELLAAVETGSVNIVQLPSKRRVNPATKKTRNYKITGGPSRQAVLNAINGNGDRFTTQDLADKTGLPNSRIWNHVSALAQLGAIERVQRGVYRRIKDLGVAPMNDMNADDTTNGNGETARKTNGTTRTTYGSSDVAKIKRRLDIDTRVAAALDGLFDGPGVPNYVDTRKLVDLIDVMRDVITPEEL